MSIVVYVIVSIPDFGLLPYFGAGYRTYICVRVFFLSLGIIVKE